MIFLKKNREGLSCRRAFFILYICCGSVGQSMAQEPAAMTFPLQAVVDSLINNSALLHGAETGVCVYDQTAGKYLCRYNDEKVSRPASNEKLLTCVAALARLGAAHKFTTTLSGDMGENLYVVGDFDPLFDEEDMNQLVFSVADKRFKKLKGRIFADVSMTDSLRYGPGWSWDDAPYSFQPALTPLMFHKGCVTLMATTRIDGTTAVDAFPASSFYRLDYTPTESKLTVTRDWQSGSNHFFVTGKVDSDYRTSVSVSSPSDFFMTTFRERLLAQGIRMKRVEKEMKKGGKGYSYRTAQGQLFPVASVSHSLGEVVKVCLKESDNLCAEAILRHLGRSVSGRSKGLSESHCAEALYGFVKDSLNMDVSPYRLADGCGLSPYNLVSPNLLVRTLCYATSLKDFATFYNALPVAGTDGTLSGRMRATEAEDKVSAKTGSLTGVSALSGYATAANGHRLVFSVISRDVRNGYAAKKMEDSLCRILCKYDK